MARSKHCSRCKEIKENAMRRYCRKCDNEWMKNWRRNRRVIREETEKTKARTYISNQIKLGKLKKLPCAHCSEVKVEAHHLDYKRPDDITWLCFPCHRAHHLKEKRDSHESRMLHYFCLLMCAIT